jgi:DNA modification methylase
MPYRRIHCYAASFGNDLARELIGKHATQGGLVLDPFVGSGTTLVEALSSGHRAIGIDVDPIACLITRTQTRRYEVNWLAGFQEDVLAQLDCLENALNESSLNWSGIEPGKSFAVNGLAAQIPERPEIEYWFSSTQRAVLASLIAYMHTLDDDRQRDILAVSISSSIVRKWPNTLSRAMDIDHSRPHRAMPRHTTIGQHFNLFERVFRVSIRVLTDLACEAEDWLDEAKVIEGHCDEEMMLLEPGSADLVLTSPPYVNAIDYPRSHKFSEWWLSPDTDLCKRSRYIGLRGSGRDANMARSAYQLAPRSMSGMKWLEDKQFGAKSGKVYRYVNDMEKAINGCKHALRRRGKLVFVLADNRIGGNVVPVVDIVQEMLERQGFRDVSSYRREIKSSRRRYPFGFKGVMTAEAVITASR